MVIGDIVGRVVNTSFLEGRVPGTLKSVVVQSLLQKILFLTLTLQPATALFPLFGEGH